MTRRSLNNTETLGTTPYAAPATVSPVSLALLPFRLCNTDDQNCTPFSQDRVTTQNGIRYSIAIDQNRNPVIVKRVLATNTVTTYDLSLITGNPLVAPTAADGHNSYSLAVDSAGYIHVSGNHHNNPLRYVRSTNPNDITAWTAPGMTGTNEDSVTYPAFVRLLNGVLLFSYRNGVSGDGDLYLNIYDVGTKTWTAIGLILSGIATSESAYPNHYAINRVTGTVDLFYIWRQTSDATTNNDICFVRLAVAANGTVTAADITGTALALPVTHATSPVIKSTSGTSAAGITSGTPGLLNQCGADVDTVGHPHMAVWLSDGASNTKLQLHHIYHDGSAWHDDVIIGGLTVPDMTDRTLSRPQVICTNSGRTLIVFRLNTNGRRGAVRAVDVTPASTGLTAYAEFTLFDVDLWSWEVNFDTRSVRERNELVMLVTPVIVSNSPDAAGLNTASVFGAQWGGNVVIDLSRLDLIVSNQARRPRVVTKATVQAGTLSAATTAPADVASPLLTNAYNKDSRLVLARVVAQGQMSGSGTGRVAVTQQPAAGGKVDVGALAITSTTKNGYTSPWHPIRPELGDLSKGGFFNARLSASANTLNLDSLLLELGVLEDEYGAPILDPVAAVIALTRLGPLAAYLLPANGNVADGAVVNTVTDASGKGNNATATSTARPTYRAAGSGMNSLPALQFAGAQYLTLPSIDTAGHFTVIAAASSSASTSQQIVASDDSGTNASRIFQLRFSSATGADALGFDAPAAARTASATVTATTPAVFTMVRLNGSTQLFVNGVLQATVSAAGIVNSGAYPIYVGARVSSSTPTNFLTGFVGQVAIYSNALSTAERMAAEYVIAAAAGIALAS